VLLEHPLIILLGVHESLNCNAVAMWSICDEVLFEITHPPDTNPGVFPLANFAGSAHTGRFGELCVCFLNAVSKTFSGVQARVLCQLNKVQDEIPPGGRTLNGPSHD
jgi:hypothetical protein